MPGQEETLRRMAAARNYNEWIFARARPYLGSCVLDAGAGIGTFTELAAARSERVVALEPDPAFAPFLAARFRDRPNVEILDEEVSGLDGEPAFDAILCFNVLEHIPDHEQALARFRDRLLPGGRLLLLVPAHPALFGATDRLVGHERRYRKADLGQILERVGFTIETNRYVNPIGALGWAVSGRLLGKSDIPSAPLGIFDRLVPLLRALDRVDVGFGLSLWAVAVR
jgi:SAM-dependent methyltransferase